MAKENSLLLAKLKGKEIDITTAAGAHITGKLEDSDGDFLQISSTDGQIFLPRNVVAVIKLAPKGLGEMSVQEAA
jgi:hypothetical protein